MGERQAAGDEVADQIPDAGRGEPADGRRGVGGRGEWPSSSSEGGVSWVVGPKTSVMVWNDFYRVREPCRAAEERSGCRRPPRRIASLRGGPRVLRRSERTGAHGTKHRASRCGARCAPRRLQL